MAEENADVNYWKISPGKGAEYWDEFKDNNWISIGWYNNNDWRETKSGDLTVNSDRAKIIDVLRDYYEDERTDRQIKASTAIIKLFLEIKPGDKVIVYDKKFHINSMCEVIGEYKFEKDFRFSHTKKVKWIKIFGPHLDEKGNECDEEVAPLDIRPIINTLETNISVPKTVIKMNKNDWDTIYNYASAIPSETHITKDLIEKALNEMGKTIASKNELITKLKEIVRRGGGVLIDDNTAWDEIRKLSDEN